jgi:hypothetical protein
MVGEKERNKRNLLLHSIMNCLILDNHMGYIGYRNTINRKIIDLGVIVVIVDNWKSIQ